MRLQIPEDRNLQKTFEWRVTYLNHTYFKLHVISIVWFIAIYRQNTQYTLHLCYIEAPGPCTEFSHIRTTAGEKWMFCIFGKEFSTCKWTRCWISVITFTYHIWRVLIQTPETDTAISNCTQIQTQHTYVNATVPYSATLRGI